jgi:WD40 repeat protein
MAWKRASVVLGVLLVGLAIVWAARRASGEPPLLVLRGHAEPVTAVAFSADGKLAASGDGAGNVKLWDVEKAAERASFRLGEGAVASLSFRPDGKLLAAGGHVPLPKIWDVQTGKERPEPQLKGLAVAFAPDNKVLAVGGQGPDLEVRGQLGALLLWDTVADKERDVRAYKGHVFRGVAYSRAGTLVTASSTEERGKFGEVRVWNATTCQEVITLEGDPKYVQAAAISADGKTVVSAGKEAGAKVWDVGPGKARFTLAGHAGEVRAVALSADGKTAVTAGADGTVRLWDAGTGKERKKWQAHKGGVEALALGADGKRLVTGGADRLVKVWALAGP